MPIGITSVEKGFAALLAIAGLLSWQGASAELSAASAAKNQPVKPFRIVGNLYYVGASDVTSYLIVTQAGSILIDGGYAETATQIESNIRSLGFRLKDVKWLLNGHAHPDHAGGLAKLKRDTGAKFAAMSAEAVPLEHNGRGTFYHGERDLFESIAVDRTLKSGDHLELGGAVLTAVLTAGHTPGCTSWSMQIRDGKKSYPVVITCQLTIPPPESAYPSMDKDFERTFAVLHALPCEVFLAEHGTAFSLTEKLSRRSKSAADNPFVDPVGYQRYIDQSEREFRAHLVAAAHE